MKKKFTFMMAALMLLTMMVLPGKAVGQAPTTTDLEWPTPSLSEDFDDLDEVSNTGPTGSSGQTYTNLTAYGIFNKIYLGKTAGHVYAIEDNDDFDSNVYKLESKGTSYLIAAVTGQSDKLGTTGAFSIKIGKTNDGYFGLYGDDDTNLSSKSKNVVYFKYNGTSLQLYNSSSSTATTTIGSNYTTDVIEICVIYNNTNSATTYGNAIPLAAKTAHVYINGNCVMNGNSPMACTLPGNNMSCFRFCTNNQANKVMTIDDLKIYNSLPTAPQAAVATPTFTQVSGRTDYNIITEDIVMLDCETDGATIYYTMGDNPADPTSSSTEYDPNVGIEVNASTTIKAIAINGNESSFVASATYTVYTPLTSMQAIYENAEANIAEHTVAITFGNWVVTGVNGASGSSNQNTAFLTDGTKGCIIYKNGGYLDFSKGDILSGSVICKLQRFSSTADYYAEITELTSNTEGLTVNTGGSVTPVVTTIDALSTVNVGSVVTIRDLYYNGTYLSDGTNKIMSYNTLGYSSYTNGKTYDVTGVFNQGSNSNSTKRILPSTSADVVLKANLNMTYFSGLTPFTYVSTQGGPSAVQSVTISGSDFSGDLTVTAPANYQVSNDDSTWGTTATYTQSSGIVSGTLYIRLAAGLSAGTYNGNLTCTATNLTTKEVALEGTVSTSALYTVSIATGIENGTIESDKTTAEKDETITITVTPADCYELATLTYNDGTTTTNIDKTTKQFAMPASNVTVNATFTQKQYTIKFSVNGSIKDDLEYDLDCGNAIILWDADDMAIVDVEIPAGFALYGWSTSAVDFTKTTPTIVLPTYVPTDDMTLYAVFATAKADGYKYTLVGTSDMEEGTYLIGALKSTTATNDFYFATKTTSSGAINVNASATTIAEVGGVRSITTLPTNAIEFAFAGNNTNGFTISSGTDYLGSSDISTNNKLAFGSDYSSFKWKAVAKDNPLLTNGVYLQYQKNTSYYYISENTTNTNCVRGYYSSNNIYRAIYLFKKGVNYNYSNYCSTVEILSGNVSGTKTGACTVASTGATVTTNTTLTVTGVLVNAYTANKLVVEDGGQLICNNSVAATVKRTTKEWNENDQTAKGWYAISSPVNNVAIADFAKGTHNVYSYDEPTHYWHEYNSSLGEIAAFDHLANGRGYLYRSTEANIEFAGDVNIANATYTLSYTDAAGNLAGFHLIGNPYTHNIYKGDNAAINSDYLTEGLYTLNVNGGWDPGTDNSTAIAPGCAVLVQTTDAGDGQTLTITNTDHQGPQAKYANDQIMFTVENTEYTDNSYVLFKKGHGLNKIEHRNAEIPMLYVISEGENYAIADMPDNTDVINLGFEAKTMGQYTISLKAEGQYSYMHLVDKLTGNDIDMLVEDSYTFVGTPNDRNDRFVLRLNYNAAGIDTESDIFAYQSGNDIMVSGEGELQVFDITGRKVMTTDINGVETINGMNRGVYIFRLNEKTQKIVVR